MAAATWNRPDLARRSRRWARLAVTAWVVIAACASNGRTQPASGGAPSAAAAAVAAEEWQGLTPAQRQFLQPLEREWPRLEPLQRRKWLMLSGRAPAMPLPERQRIQARMTEWAKLTPDQRGQARLRYQEARQLPAGDRQARWNAYQSLPPEKKQQLAARAVQPASAAHRASEQAAPAEHPVARAPLAKSNIVPNPALAAPPKPVGPALQQARPGATTTLMTKRATPPSHQQIGMPKIAATPEFVDKATLLPQRGPQGTVAGRGSAMAPTAVPAPAPAASAATAAATAASIVPAASPR